MSVVNLAVATAGFRRQAAAWRDIHSGSNAVLAVSNLGCELATVSAHDIELPVTVSHEGDDSCWVCSPYTAYVRYAMEELERFGSKWLALSLTMLCLLVGGALRAGRIDRAVAVNNWLLSTNLYPASSKIDFNSLIRECRERWPSHAIWFRSLNHHHNADIINNL